MELHTGGFDPYDTCLQLLGKELLPLERLDLYGDYVTPAGLVELAKGLASSLRIFNLRDVRLLGENAWNPTLLRMVQPLTRLEELSLDLLH